MGPIRIEHLSLTHFRNYRSLELDLPGGLVLLAGANAQGKTNLLESVFLLAAGHAHSAGADREMVGWSAAREPIPYGRAAAAVTSEAGVRTQVEVIMQLTRRQAGPGEAEAAPWSAAEEPGPPALAGGALQKAFRVNGVRQRAASSGGAVVAVLAGPEEVELIGGPPAARRRFLDLPNWQTDPAYAQALSRYQRVLAQRNALVRRSRETGGARPGEMDVWDGELAEAGSYLLERRAAMLRALEPLAGAAHAALLGRGPDSPLRFDYRGTVPGGQPMLPALRASWPRDAGAGATTVGPHRDDLRVLEGAVDLGTYGSRGQQRSVALALVLAQAAYVASVVGEEPILLLDDPLSELDAERRGRLLELCAPAPGADPHARQVLVTTADLDLVPQEIRDSASVVLRVEQGRIT